MTIPRQMPDILVNKPRHGLIPEEVERLVKGGVMEFHKVPLHSENPVKEPKKPKLPAVFCRWCGSKGPPTKDGTCRHCGKAVKQ